MRTRNKALAGGAVLLIATPFIAQEEGLRTKAYLDSVGIPTICYGETENVRMGDVKTPAQCKEMLTVKLGAFSSAIDLMVEPDMPPTFHAALTSWAYNVGLGAARKSTLIKKANAGDLRGACNELLKWKFAGGKPILLNRRERERVLCLEDL